MQAVETASIGIATAATDDPVANIAPFTAADIPIRTAIVVASLSNRLLSRIAKYGPATPAIGISVEMSAESEGS